MEACSRTPLDKISPIFALVGSRSIKNSKLKVKSLFTYSLDWFIKECLLCQPNPQKSCKVLEGEKIYDSSTYFSIIQYNKKKSCLRQITQSPSPLLSDVKWLVPNIWVFPVTVGHASTKILNTPKYLWKKSNQPHKTKKFSKLGLLRFRMSPGAPNRSVPRNICSSGNFLLAGRFGKIYMSFQGKCCWEMDNSGCRRSFGVQNNWHVPFLRNIYTPLSTLNSWISPLGHTHSYSPLPQYWRVEFCRMITPKLTYFPVTQVAGCRCTLLAGNSFISLAGSGEQINLCQQSPKMRGARRGAE